MEKISINTTKRAELVDITERIQVILSRIEVADGICFLFCPHTTAGLLINENADPSVQKDIINSMNKLVPREGGYQHAEGNSDAHIKSSLFGPSLSIFVEGGRLVLGTWQGIYLYEGDGPREREVWVKLV